MEELIKRLSPFNFSTSKELSNYIVRNRLGIQFPNISGVLEMSSDNDTWKFNGGFPPDVYRKICERLGLSNQNSSAVPGKFTSYKKLNEQDDLF